MIRVADEEYPAMSSPRYSEKSLHEQLEPIAVVGMACRLPGEVGSAGDFWDLMMKKRTGHTPRVPSSRFNIDAHYHKNNSRPGSFNVLGGYFLEEDLTGFDPAFFGITPIEARWMDPQQRKLLEVVYEALEAGGITLEAISGTCTGVYAASFTADWQQMAFREPSFRHSVAATAVDPGMISNRISHVFNLKGPSMMCNTACSSSLYALHNACNALRNGECEAAIVGGTNMIIAADQHMNTAKIGVLSATSTCHTFDDSADGYGRAEAVGAVYIKRLSDAIRDGDPIRGVIRSSAVNANGRTTAVSISQPSCEGQAAVMMEAYRRGGNLDARLTGYVECHGTGTPVGDPLEAEAISIALNTNRNTCDEPLLIGSVKPNVGHSGAASGLSSLIKAVLAVERGIIPPTYGVAKPSKAIKWNEWQVRVPTEPLPFPAHLPVRRISVNASGYGGTNAHVIIEGANSVVPQLGGSTERSASYTYYCQHHTVGSEITTRQFLDPKSTTAKKCTRHVIDHDRPFLLPFSAHDTATLQRNIAAHAKVLDRYSLLDLSHTLTTRRTNLGSNAYLVASQRTLGEILSSDSTTATESFVFGGTNQPCRKVGFVFTGQGAQWPRMGAELIKYSSVFARSIRALDNVLQGLRDRPSWKLEELLLEEASTSRIASAEFAQPLTTAVQVALVQLLDDWGVHPAVTVGHSSGEIAAAYTAGLLTAREAITAAFYRGQVARDVRANGAMLAVGIGAETLTEQYLSSPQMMEVEVACYNSPTSVTLSGDMDAIQAVKGRLDVDGVFTRMVSTGGKAYHSRHMADVASKYEELINQARADWAHVSTADEAGWMNFQRGSGVSMISSVTSSLLAKDTVLDGTYWSKNLQSPVRFDQAIQKLLTIAKYSDVDLMLEIGPHSALSGFIRQIQTHVGHKKADCLPTLLRNENGAVRLLQVAGELILRNYKSLNRAKIVRAYSTHDCQPSSYGQGRTIVDLPPYQWNYERILWAESHLSREHRQPAFPRHDLLASKLSPTWRNLLRLQDLPWLRHHRLGGYMSMAIEALTQMHELGYTATEGVIDGYILRDVKIHTALAVPEAEDGVEVRLSLWPAAGRTDNGFFEFSVSSTSHDVSVASNHRGIVLQHVTGRIRLVTRTGSNDRSFRKSPRRIPDFPQRASGRAWNKALREVGFDYGPTFQDMNDIRFDGQQHAASCTTSIKRCVDRELGESRYALHPACVDSILQLCIAAIHAGRTRAMTSGVVPIYFEEIALYPPTKSQLEAGTSCGYAWTTERGARSFKVSAQMTASDGQLVLDIVNAGTTSYEAALPQKNSSVDPLNGITQPYGAVTWNLDLDALLESLSEDQGDQKGARLLSSAVHLAELALFKDPGCHIVEVGFRFARHTLERHPLANYTVLVDDEAESEAVQALEGFRFANVHVVENGPLRYDAPASSQQPLNPPGLIVADSLSSIPPSLMDNLGSPGVIATAATEEARPSGFDVIHLENQTIYHTKAPHASGLAAPQSKTVLLVYRSIIPRVFRLTQHVLREQGFVVETCRLLAAHKVLHSKDIGQVILLADLEGTSLLHTMVGAEFSAVQKIITLSSSLLWVSAGGAIVSCKPEFALVQGLARCARAELCPLDFKTLDLHPDLSDEVMVKGILRTANLQQKPLHAVMSEPADTSSRRDQEFAVHDDGRMYISRLIGNKHVNNACASAPEPETTLLTIKDRRLSGKLVSQGELKFVDCSHDQDATQPIRPDHVEVHVHISGLSREGVLAINGSTYASKFSYEMGGVVVGVGSDVEGFRPGDTVVGFSAAKFSTFQQTHTSLVHKVENGTESKMQGLVASLLPFANAIYGLEELGRIEAEDVVLILDNTGPSGAAAVRVALQHGARPIVLQSLDTEDLPSDIAVRDPRCIIKYHASEQLESIFQRLTELTNGHGADIVFSGGSSVNTGMAAEAWRQIAPSGRFIDSGTKDISTHAGLDTTPFNRGAIYAPFDLIELYHARKEIIASLLPRVLASANRSMSEISQNKGLPFPIRVVDVADINHAVASHSESHGTPKTVVRYRSPQKPLQIIPCATRPRVSFSHDASYLLVGCLGGLGRSLTTWMMQRGARRFVFLSRTGARSPAAGRLIRDIEALGSSATVVRGDVTVYADVEAAVKLVPSEHPIRGVIHAAMVLRDVLFQSMTFTDWQTAVAPKIDGVLNLQSVLSKAPNSAQLDFFLMTSSISGLLGMPGQSNYAAANGFLDALARRGSHEAIDRTHDKQRPRAARAPVSIILPMVLGIGVVAENTKLEQLLTRTGVYGIDEEQLLEAFEVALSSGANQIIPGLDPARLRHCLDEVGEDVFWQHDARFSSIMHTIHCAHALGTGSKALADSHSRLTILETIRGAQSLLESVLTVKEHFAAKLSRLLELDVRVIDTQTSYGLDSMIGAELRKWIFNEYGLDFPFQQLLAPTLTIDKFALQRGGRQGSVL
ncbi:uncharacterized protein B0I36DRAFT_399271 [Microdochium trichocladiopsis]|uniref:Polyketide synthase n=1 Tax=Microdochium trichocladiopsis TaxID=1682393 RepID=A0A9P9BI08_9PEZI|nr:uncharacterized protein B0I36DRAFT_399271 [Microdochium trichocladiopsis]KAH7012592.1 hypothetical protein B0I36DRAFT_399271 [Microdochium trichocladiopsis]